MHFPNPNQEFLFPIEVYFPLCKAKQIKVKNISCRACNMTSNWNSHVGHLFRPSSTIHNSILWSFQVRWDVSAILFTMRSIFTLHMQKNYAIFIITNIKWEFFAEEDRLRLTTEWDCRPLSGLLAGENSHFSPICKPPPHHPLTS